MRETTISSRGGVPGAYERATELEAYRRVGTSGRHVHQSETYGFRFGDRLGWITDSGYYDGIAEQHRADVMVIHTVLRDCVPTLPHLCIADAERIIRDAKPKIAFLTHYGMAVWRANPEEIAADLSRRTGTDVRAAKDGLSIDL